METRTARGVQTHMMMRHKDTGLLHPLALVFLVVHEPSRRTIDADSGCVRGGGDQTPCPFLSLSIQGSLAVGPKGACPPAHRRPHINTRLQHAMNKPRRQGHREQQASIGREAWIGHCVPSTSCFESPIDGGPRNGLLNKSPTQTQANPPPPSSNSDERQQDEERQ